MRYGWILVCLSDWQGPHDLIRWSEGDWMNIIPISENLTLPFWKSWGIGIWTILTFLHTKILSNIINSRMYEEGNPESSSRSTTTVFSYEYVQSFFSNGFHFVSSSEVYFKLIAFSWSLSRKFSPHFLPFCVFIPTWNVRKLLEWLIVETPMCPYIIMRHISSQCGNNEDRYYTILPSL